MTTNTFLSKLFHSNTAKYILLRLLILILTSFLVVHFYNLNTRDRTKEGFTQKDKFISKFQNQTYDDFYVQVYDKLFKTEKRTEYDVAIIVKNTQPSKDSVFLDVGAGSGYFVNSLREMGYKSFGIDKSEAMVNQAETIFPEIEVKCGDVNKNSILYDKSTFSHISCLNMTIYEMTTEEKRDFFYNCHYWLVPNGYLILHLVDKYKFNTVVPIGNPSFATNPQLYSPTRIVKSEVNFPDFIYTSSYDFNKDKATFVETMTDKSTRNIRQNEKTLYMEDLKDILKMVCDTGFIIKGRVDYLAYNEDKYQCLFIFERI